MTSYRVKFLCLSLIWLCLIATNVAAQQDNPVDSAHAESKEMGIVLDLQRPSDTDVLLLRNGDKLTGTILNESFSIRTSYASLKFSNRMIAGIDLEGGANNIEAIVTVNNNRFSGFIDDSAFVFKLQTGAQIEIRREKVLKSIFRVRDEEQKGIPQRQFLFLKNGDYFSGRIKNDKLNVSTTYAKVPLDLKNAESVTLIGGQNPLTKILMRNNDTLQGVLETEDISVELDVGPTINIYQDRINIFYCRDGFIPNIGAVYSSIAVEDISDQEKRKQYSNNKIGLSIASIDVESARQYKIEKETKGVVVIGVKTGSQAYESGFIVGDIIKEVNHKTIISKDDYYSILGSLKLGDQATFLLQRKNKGYMVIKLSHIEE